MSESTAASSIVAAGGDGLQARGGEALRHERRRRAHGVEGRAHGQVRLDRADVVVVEDLDDLRLLDPRRALGLLRVVDQHHLARRGRDERGAPDEPERPPPRVDDHRRAVLDVEDLRRHVLEHVVGLDGQRIRDP